MTVGVQFWSYFAAVTGTRCAEFEVPIGSVVGELLEAVYQRFPSLAPFRSSTLIAIHLDYAAEADLLPEGAQVSLFPPVQGG